MKKILLFCLFSLPFLSTWAQEIPAAIAKPDSAEQIFQYVDVSPEFPGGEVALHEFLAAHLDYPKDAGLPEGVVVLSFIVTNTGEIKDVLVLKPLHRTLAIAAVRAVKQMPNWTPGKVKDQNVNTRFVLPVRFTNDAGKRKTKVKHKK